ncbi:T9SS type A sorting domain-containing protein [Chryseobacterium indologenes]|uniref:T9SS type A sorting domain-containing protein n=1 Tax=Chryseobacterium indologenes TaxID=253 RepID=UPI001BCCB92F|nr:T9SS type A sorting domain-containing protein [Chryseobacterium indologenes]
MRKLITTSIVLVSSLINAQINLIPDSNFGNNSTVDLGSDVTAFLSYHFLNDKIMVQNYDLVDPDLTYSRVTMLNNNGSLDGSFGTGGSFLFPKNYNANEDADFVYHLTSSHLFMFSGRKYLYNGTLDQTYGTNGQSLSYHPSEIYRKVLPDGKLIIRTINNFYRYTQSGNLDTTFGTNGSLVSNNLLTNYGYPTFDYHQEFVPLFSDNSVLEYDGNYSHFRKMNYTTGYYDTNFGVNGDAQFSTGTSATIMKFRVLNDNSFINYLFDNNTNFLTKTLSTGMLDNSFGNNGRIDLPSNISATNLLYNQDFAAVNDNNFIIPVFDDNYPKKMYLANFNNNGLSTINSQNLLDTGITTAMVNPDDKVFISVKDGYLYLFVNPRFIKRYLISENTLNTRENINKTDEISFNNPFKDELHFKTTEKIKFTEIYDEAGKLVLKNSGQKDNNTSALPKGVYIIKITKENGQIISKKAIKN